MPVGGAAGGAWRSAALPLAPPWEARSHGPITDTDTGTVIRPTAITTAIRPTATATVIPPTATVIRRTTATVIAFITATTAHVISCQRPSIARALLVAALSRVSSCSVVESLAPLPRGLLFPIPPISHHHS